MWVCEGSILAKIPFLLLRNNLKNQKYAFVFDVASLVVRESMQDSKPLLMIAATLGEAQT